MVIFTFILPLYAADFMEPTFKAPMNVLIPIIVLGFIGYILAKRFGLRRNDIWIDNGELYIKEYSQILEKPIKTKKVKLSKIRGFDDFTINTGDMKFQLKFDYSATYTIYRSRIWFREDDFESLIEDFKDLIKNPDKLTSEGTKKQSEKIEVKYSNPYQTAFSKILFLGALIFIAIIIGLTLTEQIPIKGTTILVFTTLLAFIFTYLNKRNNNNYR